MVNQNRSVVSTIKSKLIAAVAMLLVGVFMVISSSYAWFTLSTAPEVTGIYTSVGANGNLEMALVPSSGDLNDITTGVGQTGINTSWGNLVDLGEDYGLDKIYLMPARLDVTGNKLNGVGLLAPTYGADGRVANLSAVSSSYYDSGSWKVGSTSGVSALGVASGMTLQQTAWVQYKRNINVAVAASQNLAHGTFTDYGTPLANVVMTRAMKGTNAEFDISFVPAMLTALNSANVKVAEAAKYYFAAKAAQALYNVSDSVWGQAEDAIAALDFTTLEEGATSITVEGTPVPFDTVLTKTMAQYHEIQDKLDATSSAWTTFIGTQSADAEAATWTQAKSVLIDTGFLVYEDQILVSGKTTDQLRDLLGGEALDTSNIPDELMDFGLEFVQNGTVDFTSGSGVHADFAEIVGEYQAEISVSVSLGSSTFTNDKVKLRTIIDGDGERVDMYKALTTQPADNNSDGTVKLITDFYGYMLDFAFRTNAQGSNLMLQTSPVGRIYATNGSEETMGHGSTMTFAISDTSFSVSQAKMLMSAVRIVFVDNENNIVALGLLAQPSASGTFAETDHQVSANNEITSSIYLYEYSFGDDGKLVIGNKKEATNGKTAIMELGQNTATKLSVIVYLDGDVVDNSMVAAEKTASLVGSLNLQFGSSATLVPMEYTEFQGNGGTGTTSGAAGATTEAPAESTTEAP